MTPPIWANYPLALLFLSAWAGIPLQMTSPPHTPTCPARAALATDSEPETGPGHHLSSAGGPAKNHPPARRATGRSAR
jgi:hypothetical protein